MKKWILLILLSALSLNFAACGLIGTIGKDSTEPTGIAAEYDGTLRSLIPKSRKLKMDKGTWGEQDGYGYLLLTGCDRDDYNDYREVLRKAGYSGGSGGRNHNTDAEYMDYRAYDFNTQTEYFLRTLYYQGSIAIVVGDIPHSHTCYQLLGIPKDQLGQGYFEGDVEDYLPAGTSFDLRFSDVSYNDSTRQMLMRDITIEQVEEYISITQAYGYVETRRRQLTEAADKSLLYEATMIVDRDLNIGVHLQIAWYDGKLLVHICNDNHIMEEADMWEYAMNYDGTYNGQDPDSIIYPPLDLSTATVEEKDGCTLYYLENIENVESVRNYCDELYQMGYMQYFEHEPDNTGMNCVNERLYLPDKGKESYIAIVYAKNKALIVKSEEECPYIEAQLWEMLGVPAHLGMGYLQYAVKDFIYSNATVGSGTGMSTEGYLWRFNSNSNMDEFSKTVASLNKAGFDTEYSRMDDGNYHEYIFYRTDDFTYSACTIYAKVTLDGNYLEVEFGYGIREGNHKDG